MAAAANNSALLFGSDLVVRTRFIPPRPKPQQIVRLKVNKLLDRIADYPLTFIKAEAGYGKTTAVAAYIAFSRTPAAWYSLSDASADPLTFLLHIIYAFRAIYPAVGDFSLRLLSQQGGASRHWAPAVDALVNDLLDALQNEIVLILDDYSQVNEAAINVITERFIDHMPPRLHVVITTREMPNLNARARWRATGELLEIGRSDLAFTPEEINDLFQDRGGGPISPILANILAAETEGWPIAVQLLSEGVSQTPTLPLDDLVRRLPGPLEHLFEFLAQEVYEKQPVHIQKFLAETTVLRRLDPELCDFLFDRVDSDEILRHLEEKSLFVIGEGVQRYHSLFHDFLRRRMTMPNARRRELHRRAAKYYQVGDEVEDAVYHLINAGEHESAADLLNAFARALAYSGRHQLLSTWLDQLPDDLLDGYPELLLARGHAYRFASKFDESLDAYRRAQRKFEAQQDSSGEVRALRGQTHVFLDTVQPLPAEPLLRTALQKINRDDRSERVDLLLLKSENLLNSGYLSRAERLYNAVYCVADELDLPPMNPRIYIRDGRFAQGRHLVKESLRRDPWGVGEWRAPRSHREATALLAWIDAMTGDAQSARSYARHSLELGRALSSPIVQCISLSRLGHAWLTGPDFDPDRANQHYQEALAIAIQIGISRFQVESQLGLTMIAGLKDDATAAIIMANQALRILQVQGDVYMKSILTMTLGAALTLCEDAQAEGLLIEASHLGKACGDRFGPCLANLWLAIYYGNLGLSDPAEPILEYALTAAEAHGYDFLFTSMPFLGPKSFAPRLLLLNHVSTTSKVSRYAAGLRSAIAKKGNPDGAYGYLSVLPAAAPLYIQTLGSFVVRRAGRVIQRSTWERVKAVHLLQYLICHRGQNTPREQIIAALWPETPQNTAATGLRVALSALRRALASEAGSESKWDFIIREGDSLQLDLSLGIYIDSDEFLNLTRLARRSEGKDPGRAITQYDSALALYCGDFLQDNLYAPWAQAERALNLDNYLNSAERLAKLLIDIKEYERGLRWSKAILAKDPLWEEAYVLSMFCHWKLGNRALAVRVYDRCRRRLRRVLSIEPSQPTTALFEEISQN